MITRQKKRKDLVSLDFSRKKRKSYRERYPLDAEISSPDDIPGIAIWNRVIASEKKWRRHASPLLHLFFPTVLIQCIFSHLCSIPDELIPSDSKKGPSDWKSELSFLYPLVQWASLSQETGIFYRSNFQPYNVIDPKWTFWMSSSNFAQIVSEGFSHSLYVELADDLKEGKCLRIQRHYMASESWWDKGKYLIQKVKYLIKKSPSHFELKAQMDKHQEYVSIRIASTCRELLAELLSKMIFQ